MALQPIILSFDISGTPTSGWHFGTSQSIRRHCPLSWGNTGKIQCVVCMIRNITAAPCAMRISWFWTDPPRDSANPRTPFNHEFPTRVQRKYRDLWRSKNMRDPQLPHVLVLIAALQRCDDSDRLWNKRAQVIITCRWLFLIRGVAPRGPPSCFINRIRYCVPTDGCIREVPNCFVLASCYSPGYEQWITPPLGVRDQCKT